MNKRQRKKQFKKRLGPRNSWLFRASKNLPANLPVALGRGQPDQAWKEYHDFVSEQGRQCDGFTTKEQAERWQNTSIPYQFETTPEVAAEISVGDTLKIDIGRPKVEIHAKVAAIDGCIVHIAVPCHDAWRYL